MGKSSVDIAYSKTIFEPRPNLPLACCTPYLVPAKTVPNNCGIKDLGTPIPLSLHDNSMKSIFLSSIFMILVPINSISSCFFNLLNLIDMLGVTPLCSAASSEFSTSSLTDVKTARKEFPKPAIDLFSLKNTAADAVLALESLSELLFFFLFLFLDMRLTPYGILFEKNPKNMFILRNW